MKLEDFVDLIHESNLKELAAKVGLLEETLIGIFQEGSLPPEKKSSILNEDCIYVENKVN